MMGLGMRPFAALAVGQGKACAKMETGFASTGTAPSREQPLRRWPRFAAHRAPGAPVNRGAILRGDAW
jgi:hypothetical protein